MSHDEETQFKHGLSKMKVINVYVIHFDGFNVVLDGEFVEMNNMEDSFKLAKIIEEWVNL